MNVTGQAAYDFAKLVETSDSGIREQLQAMTSLLLAEGLILEGVTIQYAGEAN